MYQLKFYKDAHNNCPVETLINGLDQQANTNKSARIELRQITLYLDILERLGTRAGEPYVKHIKNGIWELRPGKNRIFFFGCNGNTLVLLHNYVKKSQRTPQREIQQAEREMNNWRILNGL